MPAYSYKERFIPFLLDESKGHTVRAERSGKSRHARPGETIYHYYGMRTKWCRKIGESVCTMIQEIFINGEGIILGSFSYDKNMWFGAEFLLSEKDRDEFAWKDGFRPEGSNLQNSSGAWELMLRFWKQTHDLPFSGVVIYWKDFNATPKENVKYIES